MKNNNCILFYKYSILIILIIFYSCSSSDDSNYTVIEVSPVVLNLENVPYANLSEYKFFKGEIKNQQPSYGVIPFKPAVNFLQIMH